MKTAIYMFGALAFVASANATTVTCSFNSPTGDLGSTTHTYSCGGFNITATAFGGGNLFGKNDGGDEVGVGLTSDPSGQNEITPGHFIQLDLVNILGNNPMSLVIGSNTGDDRGTIWNTSVAGVAGGTALVSNTGSESPFTLNPTLRYLDLSGTAGNILLGPLTFTTS